MEPRNDGQAVGDSSGWTAGPSSTAPTCRLCWDEEGALPDGMLLSPCKCAGSSAYIHRGCLQTWLNTRPRSHCDICRSPYDTALLADAGVSIPPPRPDYYLSEARMRQDFAAARAAWWQQLAGQRPGGGNGAIWAPPGAAAQNPGARDALWWWWAPRRRRWWVRDPWQDSLFWSGLLHGAWRVVIALDGIAATLKLMRTRRAPAGGALPWPFGGRHSAVAAARVAAAARAGRRGAVPPSAAEEVRASFNGTTVWQVQLYSAIIALTTTSTAAEAASGMALGAIIGGCLSSLVFLPLVGLSKLSALRGTLRLAATAGVRLAAGLACRPAGYRRLAGALARLGGPVGWAVGRAGAAVAWGVDAVRSRLPPPPPPPGAAPQPAAQQQPPQQQPQQQQRQRPGRQQQPQQQQQQGPPRGLGGQWPQQRAAAW